MEECVSVPIGSFWEFLGDVFRQKTTQTSRITGLSTLP
jgi:hypothetical protein